MTGVTLEEYDSDRKLELIIEREFMIIGEALRYALEADPDLSKRISSVREIIGFRNRLVHNYPDIDSRTILRIVSHDLPTLLAEVRALLPPPPAP